MVQFIDYDQNYPGVKNQNNKVFFNLAGFKVRFFDLLKNKKFQKTVGIVLLVLVFLVTLSYFFILRPGQEVYAQIKVDKSDVKKLQQDATSQNVVAANKDVDTLNIDLTVTQQRFSKLAWVGLVPFFGGYYSDGIHLLSAGKDGLAAGKIITTALLPFAGVLSSSGPVGTTTAGSKLETIVSIMPKIAPETDQISQKLALANNELQLVNTSRYPQSMAGIKIQQSLQSAKDLVKLISDFMPQAKNVLLYAPQGLGSPSPRKYMVIFQNDKELRPSGGFLTAYTFATFTGGKITTSATNDIYTLDATVRNKPPAPAPILKYLPLVYSWNLRDTNLSPDFTVSMQNFEYLYKKSSQYQPNDGYIGIDTYFLQSLLKLTGPIKSNITGATYTSSNVVPLLETYAEKVFVNDPNRKGFLGELMRDIMAKLTKSQSNQWPSIISTIITSFNQKHILLDSKDPHVESLIQHYDWGGIIQNFNGDYLHVNDANFAGAKANLYVTEKITQDINIASDGTVTKTTSVTETNPVRTDGWLNGPYRDWIRMYVPEGSTLVKAYGGRDKIGTSTDLGKTVFDNFVVARPYGSSSSDAVTWSVTYTLPNKVTGHVYKLYVQKQPGTAGPQLVININDHQKFAGQLTTDKEYDLSF